MNFTAIGKLNKITYFTSHVASIYDTPFKEIGIYVKLELFWCVSLSSHESNYSLTTNPIWRQCILGEIENPNANDAGFVPVIISETRNPEKWNMDWQIK